MKLNKTLLAALAATSLLAGTASAQTVINITGATAFRSSAINSINNAFAGNPYSVVFTNTDVAAAAVGNNAGDYQIWRGTFPGISGETIIRTSWNGSVEGVRALAAPSVSNNASYIPTSVVPAVPVSGVTQVTQTYLVSNGNATQAAADLAFSDVTKSSTPVTGTIFGGPVGIIVFTMVANKTWRNDFNSGNFTGMPTSISAQQFKQVMFNGNMPLSYFTSNGSHTSKVYATGRNDGSGTRSQYLIETGYGVSKTVNQVVGYDRTNATVLPSIVRTAKGGGFNSSNVAKPENRSTIWGQDLDGNGGYNSGSEIRSDMAKTTDSCAFYEFEDLDESGAYTADEAQLRSTAKLYLLSWLSVADAKNARGNNASATANAMILGYNGVRLDDLETTAAALASTGLSTNDRAKVTRGAYTAWGYEQLFHLNSANQVAVFNELKNNRLTTASVLGSAGIPLSEMLVNRSGDGQNVVSGPLP